ncbi:MAG: hypothetical protein ACNA7W_13550 [Pseudomonadales bacterium]
MDIATVRRLIAGWMLCGAAPFAWPVNDVAGLGDIDLGVWSPATGSLTGGDDFCVSTDPGLGASGKAGNYGVLVTPLASTAFELVSASAPGAVIPATIDFEDLISGVVETLVPAALTQRNKNGLLDCVGPNNARLSLTLAAADLVAAPPGEYLAPLQFTGQRANKAQSRDFVARVRVLELIRISGLDPIDLGAFDGVNDARGGDDFCIYSNSASGIYSVTAYGQGAGELLMTSGAEQVGYALEYDDGSGFVPVPANSPVQRGNAESGAVDCGGGSNARIRITAARSDLESVPAGVYSGELTLLVAPM